MSDSISKSDLADVQKGLRIANPPDPELLAAEKKMLTAVESEGVGKRVRTYMGLIGPGYMQSAMTLGGGTASASLFAGACFGYKLLWVAPTAMLFGVLMLAAISHMTLSTGMRPFAAMCRYAGRPLAWGWAIGALVSSVIWHIPQYTLASVCLQDMVSVFGFETPQMSMSIVILVWAVMLSMMYGVSDRMVRWYERLLKYMVWGIVLCFGFVVAKTGIRDWGELFAGFFGFEVPGEKNGTSGTALVLAGFGAAVGINMVFLYPYSLLARGWGREHRKLARFDLYTSMFVPYLIATSLMIIATANTVNLDDGFSASRLAPLDAAKMLSPLLGSESGRVIFDLGFMGMALSSITLQMLVCGFVCSEMFGWEFGGKKYRLAMLIPTPSVFGPMFWGEFSVYLAVPTTIICACFLPLAYIGFLVMQRSKRYLGDDFVPGWRGRLVFALMLAVTVFFVFFLFDKAPGQIEKFIGKVGW